MKTLRKNMNMIAAVIIFVLAIALYNFFKPEFVPQDIGSVQTAGADLVMLSERIQSVSLDQSLFATNLYLSLSDFSTELAPQPTGRANPFAIIGSN